MLISKVKILDKTLKLKYINYLNKLRENFEIKFENNPIRTKEVFLFRKRTNDMLIGKL